MSRINFTVKNFFANGFRVLLTLISSFAVRTVFIQTLGKEYLGISGLFNNILSILSLAELGIGTAIAFKLYKPLADGNQHRVRLLMKFYKRAYQAISAAIIMLGLLLMPFLGYIIKDKVDFVNINIVFLIFLLQTASSYMLFAYKSTLIKADQREYIIIKLEYIIEIFSCLVQITVLFVFGNYIFYISSVVFFNLIKNILIAKKVDKDYPYLNYASEGKLSKDELKELFKDIGSVFLYKINSVVLQATDNILISIYIGLATVGLYSNYLLITTALNTIIKTFYSAIKASIGNLHATSDATHEYFIFRVINLLTIVLFGGAAIGIFVISNMFINIWIGQKYEISMPFSLLLAIEFYLRGIQLFLSQFRTSMGLFQQAKYRPVFGMVINLVVSLLLVQYIGIYGVLIGTIVASLTTYMWYDPIIIHQHGFKTSCKKYFLKNAYYFSIVVIAGIMSLYSVSIIHGGNLIHLVIKIAICIITSSFVFSVFFFRTEEAKYLLKNIRHIVSVSNGMLRKSRM